MHRLIDYADAAAPLLVAVSVIVPMLMIAIGG